MAWMTGQPGWGAQSGSREMRPVLTLHSPLYVVLDPNHGVVPPTGKGHHPSLTSLV